MLGLFEKLKVKSSTGTAAPRHKCCGILRVASNPSVAGQSRSGLVLHYYAINRYFHDHQHKNKLNHLKVLIFVGA